MRFEVPRISFQKGHSDGTTSLATLPDGMALSGINSCLRILEEIERAHGSDARPEQKSPIELTSAEVKYLHAYVPRLMWRLGSYVMFATTVEGVIEHAFRESVLPLAMAVAHYSEPIAQLAARAAEIEPLMGWRHKVFAHTAYADPREPKPGKPADPTKHDNLATRLSSLHLLAGGSFHVDVDGDLVIGGRIGIGRTDATGAPILEEATSMAAPPLAFGAMVRAHSAHIAEWQAMYESAMEAVRALDDSAFSYIPGLQAVIR